MAKVLEAGTTTIEMITDIEKASNQSATLQHGYLSLLRELVENDHADEEDLEIYFRYFGYDNHDEL